MSSRSRYLHVREELPKIKQLFQTRRYNQCASLCERYLDAPSANQIHPVHGAYLNFYLALCHDTTARETSIKHRTTEVALAEKHYLAAIAVLTPQEPPRPRAIRPHSPASSDDECDGPGGRHFDTASVSSEHSASTDATSVSDDHLELARQKLAEQTGFQRQLGPVNQSGLAVNVRKPWPSTVVAGAAPRSATCEDETALFMNASAFISMIKTHLAGVRELRDSPHVRPSLQHTRSSYSLRSSTYGRDCADAGTMETVRQQRKGMAFRPRFDPSSVQRLCNDALSEL